ncbi:hypothetical protein AAMO2058_000070700 [Amorphochlora amoebiformis]
MDAKDEKVTTAGSKSIPWQDLDTRSFFMVYMFLGHLSDVLRAMRVCKAWAKAGEAEVIWARMCDRAGWPQLGKVWFQQKYVDICTFKRPAQVASTLECKSSVLKLFAPTPVELFNWRTGRAAKVNRNLVAIAEAYTGTDLIIWDVNKAIPIRVDSGEEGSNSWSALAINPSKVVFADSKDARVILRELDTGVSYLLGKHNSTVTSVAINKEGTLALSGSYDNTVRLWDLQKYCQKLCLPVSQRSWGGAIHPSGEVIAAGTSRELCVWRVHDGKCVGKMFLASERTIMAVKFDTEEPDTYIYCGGYDEKITMWNYQSGQRVRTFAGHTGVVFDCVVLRSVLITCSRDKSVKIYDKHTGLCLQTIAAHTMDVKTCVYLKPFRIVTGSFDRTVKVWDFPKRNRGPGAAENTSTNGGECTVM